MLGADLRLDRREILLTPLAQLDTAKLAQTIEHVAQELTEQLRFGSRVHFEENIYYALALRYQGQEHTVRIAARTRGTDVPSGFVDDTRRAFEDEYVRRYGHLDPSSSIEVVELEVVAERPLPQVRTTEDHGSEGSSGEISSRWGQDQEALVAAVIPRGTLSPDDQLTGPAVIYEEGSTAVIPPHAPVVVERGGTLSVDLRPLAGES
jgi:N-methylhydantoinase A